MKKDLTKYDCLVDVFTDEITVNVSNHILEICHSGNKDELRTFLSRLISVGPKMRGLVSNIIQNDFPQHKKLLDKMLLLI